MFKEGEKEGHRTPSGRACLLAQVCLLVAFISPSPWKKVMMYGFSSVSFCFVRVGGDVVYGVRRTDFIKSENTAADEALVPSAA